MDRRAVDVGGGLIAYRKSWLEEAGCKTFPETWETFREAGKKLKAKGRPIGQTAGHTFGDAPGWWYPFLWSWGGKEVEADGKTVVLNSKETVESIKFAVALWKETMDEGGLAWDDTNNNRAFLSQTISATKTAPRSTSKQEEADTYQTEKGPPMSRTSCTRPPQGAGGPVQPAIFHRHADGYSKNQKAAKDFLKWLHSRPATTSGSLAAGVRLRRHQGVGKQPGVERRSGDDALQGAARLGRRWATPARPTPRPPRGSKYIIVDMYAKAIQGMPPEEAVKWAASELQKIYAA